jgi:hypothetical protein
MMPALVVAVAASVAATAAAQRGGNDAIANRSGSWFVTVELPKPEAEGGKIGLEACSVVKDAVEKESLSFLYLVDPAKNPVKHGQFEQVIFGHAEIGAALRAFRCGRIDLAKDAVAKAEYGEQAPLFVAFDAKGKRVGDVSMRDYRAKATPIVRLLERAAAGHGKIPLASFVSKYRELLTDLQVHDGRKSVLDNRRARLDGRKQAEVDKEAAELERAEQELLEREKKLLELARIPERDPKAQRLGGRGRGR